MSVIIALLRNFSVVIVLFVACLVWNHDIPDAGLDRSLGRLEFAGDQGTGSGEPVQSFILFLKSLDLKFELTLLLAGVHLDLIFEELHGSDNFRQLGLLLSEDSGWFDD